MVRPKKRTLQQQISLAVVLSLNIHLEKYHQTTLLTIPLVSLSWLALLWWQGSRWLHRLEYTIQQGRQTLQYRWRVTMTLVSIGCQALAFGLVS